MQYIEKSFFCVQNIILNCRVEVEKLFVQVTETKNNSKIYSTDTYFNIFHYTRWHDLTGCDKFFLRVFCRGKGKLNLLGIRATSNDSSPTKGICSPAHIASYSVDSNEIYQQWSVELNKSFDFYYLTLENKIGENLDIEKAYYAISSEQCKRDVNIAIVSVTYNRVKDINHLVKTYTSACRNNKYFGSSSHLYVINNEYSDKELLTQYEQENTTIINNKENYGGSGGFAQGARMAVENGRFTHVLFMDDDALIHEESWLRTTALLRCLRDDLYEHPISGTMFTREQPTYCHAVIEALNKHLHRICLSGANFLDKAETCRAFLTSAHEICRKIRCTEGQPPYPYAAWWYCLFPISVFVKHGYPAPYFFCGDDIEYGLRIKKSPLFLNGICIWHPDFKNKSSPLREYLSLRNYALRCKVYMMKSWRYELIKTLVRKIARCLAANDYERGALTILAIKDFMNFNHIPREGDLLIAHVEAERQHWTNIRGKIPILPRQISDNTLRVNLFSMICVFLTLGGAIVPSFLRRRCTVASFIQVKGRWASQWTTYPGKKDLYKIQELKAIKLTVTVVYISIKLLLKKIA